MLHGPKPTQARAKSLRRAMTLPEVLLWRELRLRPGGLKFRRQHPAGVFVLDFFCAARRLAVEVDGEVHGLGDRPERDAVRDAWLLEQSVRVVRIPARDVLRDMPAVIAYIVATAEARGALPLHQPAAGPPPPSGEDF